MNDLPPAFWAADFGASIVLGAAIIWWSWRRAEARSVRGIMRRLTHPGSKYSVRSGYINGVWDPSKPLGSSNPLLDRGKAEYSLDDKEHVHLVFRSASGGVREFSGQVPDAFHDSPIHRRYKRTVHVILGSYLALISAGFTVGYVVASGGIATRFVVGLVGAFVAMALAVVMARLTMVGRSIRAARRGEEGRTTSAH
jgi:hypothetical protein